MIKDKYYYKLLALSKTKRKEIETLERELFHIEQEVRMYDVLTEGIIKIVYDNFKKAHELMIQMELVNETGMKLSDYNYSIIPIQSFIKTPYTFDLGETMFLTDFFTTRNQLGLTLTNLLLNKTTQ